MPTAPKGAATMAANKGEALAEIIALVYSKMQAGEKAGHA